MNKILEEVGKELEVTKSPAEKLADELFTGGTDRYGWTKPAVLAKLEQLERETWTAAIHAAAMAELQDNATAMSGAILEALEAARDRVDPMSPQA